MTITELLNWVCAHVRTRLAGRAGGVAGMAGSFPGGAMCARLRAPLLTEDDGGPVFGETEFDEGLAVFNLGGGFEIWNWPAFVVIDKGSEC